jgi:hypothetical protein
VQQRSRYFGGIRAFFQQAVDMDHLRLGTLETCSEAERNRKILCLTP